MKRPDENCVTAHRTRQRPQWSAPSGPSKSPAKPDPAANDANSKVLGGSFLDAWFQTLRCSQTYRGNCRSGQFSEESARQTYRWFGALDGLSLEQWWAAKGSAQFRESIVPVRIRAAKTTGRSQERVGGELWVSVPLQDPIPGTVVKRDPIITHSDLDRSDDLLATRPVPAEPLPWSQEVITS